MLNESEVRIRFADEFERELYILSKRYRRIRADIEPIIKGLQAGNFVGDRIGGLGAENQVLKVRVKNSDIQKGKSAGYRLIYLVESPTSILLLTIYSKCDRQDISLDEIRGILDEFYGGEDWPVVGTGTRN